MILVGDRRTPDDWREDNVIFLSLDVQRASGIRLAVALPENHYSRKNLGYLEAIRRGAGVIVESDDDNTPVNWRLGELSEQVNGPCVSSPGWINIYRLFTDSHIWPRGFPLEELEPARTAQIALVAGAWRSPVQQFLAGGDPDVDAVYRLTVGKTDHEFNAGVFVLGRDAITPFNSQSTVWWPQAYPLMYLPSHVSFRMTDIWRSFVAQVCLWAMDMHLAYHSTAVHQQRNVHDLLRDFRDEIPGYTSNAAMVRELTALDLSPDASDISLNLRACYKRLVEVDVVPKEELRLVDLWVEDLEALTLGSA